MPAITLQFKGKTIREYPLEPGKVYSIGRRSKNEIVVDNLAVSGHHAQIESVGDEFIVKDLGSKNGTFVNRKLIKAHTLRYGDVITIGKHTLRYTQAGDISISDDEKVKMTTAPIIDPTEGDATMMMDTDQYRDLMASNAPTDKKRQGPVRENIGKLSYLAGGEGDIILNKKLIKIGKDPLSDIVVNGFFVGKTSATVSMRPNGYYLTYVQGFTKPKVNGRAIKESVKLKEFDVIKIGSSKMQFVYGK